MRDSIIKARRLYSSSLELFDTSIFQLTFHVLVLDESTEGIQPSIIQQIERVIGLLRDKGEMAILLVEQYFEFAQALADRFAVMERGQIVLAGTRAEMDEAKVRSRLTV